MTNKQIIVLVVVLSCVVLAPLVLVGGAGLFWYTSPAAAPAPAPVAAPVAPVEGPAGKPGK